MRILVVSQYFFPEEFKVNDLVVELIKRGHHVTVLTGKPNYPQGKIYKGYSFWGYQEEEYKGARIIRVPLIPRGKSTGLRLAINYLSYVLFSCLYILFHNKKYDMSFTFAISPITQICPALLQKWLYHTKAVIWVQDLWPESLTAAGKMKSKIIYAAFEKMVKHVYNMVDDICVQSTGFINSIVDKGIRRDKIFYVPNWAENIFTSNNLFDKLKFQNLIPDGFVVMFTGNIGESQDFDSILRAAIELKSNKVIKWIIVGDGRRKSEIEKMVNENGLSETFFLLGRLPLEDMPNIFVHADTMLVSLKDEYIFSLTIPSKLQSYMAFGKPIVSMLNGIGNEVIKEADCGFIASAGNYKQLANNILKAYHSDKEQLNGKGLNGRKYYEQNFSKNKIIDDLLIILNK